MTDLRTAVQQALDQLLEDRNALYECHSVPGQIGVSVDDDAVPALLRYDEIIGALRAALAEPEEPEGGVCARCDGLVFDPAVPQPKAEPLTDEEIDTLTRVPRDALLDHVYEYGTNAEGTQCFIRKIARAIEAAHGIGATGKDYLPVQPDTTKRTVTYVCSVCAASLERQE